MNQNDTLVELRDIFANVLANASFSVLQDFRKLRHVSRLTSFFLFIKASSRAKDVCGICSGKS